VQATRAGDADRALTLLEIPDVQDWLEKDRFTKLSLLAVLGGSAALLPYVSAELTAHPELVRTPYTYDGTLLHAAARSESPEFVRLLLRLGADPNASDRFGHVPLGGVHHPDIVRALVEGGADVNARDGLKGVTALHNAARHGNVAVGAALLECGADMESRDDLGDTPLRRAVNCGKTEMAAFLLERGADRHSVGSRGLTPAQAARGPAMKQWLCS
jgi:ankyrin repeat protein